MLDLERSSYHRRYISVLGRHIDKHELKCTCVGGDSNVPLGFVSLTENLMMVTMAVWMLTQVNMTVS